MEIRRNISRRDFLFIIGGSLVAAGAGAVISQLPINFGSPQDTEAQIISENIKDEQRLEDLQREYQKRSELK
ncbi:MAG TPA: hypothetical protein VG895_01200 [Patescibacteria group bacterium]|nr:hypothetical protein [Patescibacteria group bacterium]